MMDDCIFLVDDDPGVRKALARSLREEGWRVECFESAEAFVARPDRAARGCLVLDLTMPGLDGLQLQQLLADSDDALPIVFLSGRADIPTTVQAMKAGAHDFLTKPVGAAKLGGAVRLALAQDRRARQSAAIRVACERRLAGLTAREQEVLRGLVDGKLNKQIASDLGIVEQTVKFHRARIMERMQASTLAELMHMAARAGLEPASLADRGGALLGGQAA
jgi:FixJ family two-component response regulator